MLKVEEEKVALVVVQEQAQEVWELAICMQRVGHFIDMHCVVMRGSTCEGPEC